MVLSFSLQDSENVYSLLRLSLIRKLFEPEEVDDLADVFASVGMSRSDEKKQCSQRSNLARVKLTLLQTDSFIPQIVCLSDRVAISNIGCFVKDCLPW